MTKKIKEVVIPDKEAEIFEEGDWRFRDVFFYYLEKNKDIVILSGLEDLNDTIELVYGFTQKGYEIFYFTELENVWFMAKSKNYLKEKIIQAIYNASDEVMKKEYNIANINNNKLVNWAKSIIERSKRGEI